MNKDRYHGGGAERPLARHPAGPRGTPHPAEKRYATQGTRDRDRRRDHSRDERPPEQLSPLLEIARYDEQHHYGRQSVERRQDEQTRRRQEREDEETQRRMRREQRGRSYGGRRRGPQSRS